MEKPDVVPDKLTSPINYRVILLIIICAITFQSAISFLFAPETSDVIISIVSFINPIAAAIAGFFVVKKYSRTRVFGRSYLFLSLGFLSVFFGELSYLILDLVLELPTYPSIADVFFFAYSPFLIAHLILNIRFFKPDLNLITKVWVSLIPILIVSAYVFVSLSELGEANFDFFYGIIFVTATSITLSLTILGTKILKEGTLGKAWMILLFGVLALTFADDWYYYLELLGEYDLSHPVNIFWYAGYWIVFYALLKHRKIM